MYMVDQMIQKSGKMHEETNLLTSNLLDLKHVKIPCEYLTYIFFSVYIQKLSGPSRVTVLDVKRKQILLFFLRIFSRFNPEERWLFG